MATEGKVGRFLGGLAGMAAPVAAGAYASNMYAPDLAALAGSDVTIPDDPMGPGGAIGGLGGTVAGAALGHKVGAAVGDYLGDKVGQGARWAWNKVRRKRPTGPTYLDRLAAGRTDLDPDAVSQLEPPAKESPKVAATQDARAAKDAVSQFEDKADLSRTLRLGLMAAGYPAKMVARYGYDTDLVNAWGRNDLARMIHGEIAAGRKGTARHIALQGINKLQAAGLLPKPSPDDEIDLADPQHHAPPPRQLDLFGDEPEAPAAKRSAKGGRRKKRANNTPSLF